MRIGWPGQARLSLVRQSPLLRGRFSFQDEVTCQAVIDLVVPGRSVPSSRTAEPPAALWPPDLPGDDTEDAGRVTVAPDDRIGLGEQIAADLLPEAGDSRSVDGGEGL